MHHMCYVLAPLSKVKSSLEAREYVYDRLNTDKTFVGDLGLFGSPVCDRFVIGGRWSGELRPKKMLDEFWGEVRQLNKPDLAPPGFGVSFIQEHRDLLDTIWKKLSGKYESPLTRSPYETLGEEDDAMLLTSWLAQDLNIYLSAEEYYRDEWYIGRRGMSPIVISLDSRLCDLKDFGSLVCSHWVVIIDYHV